MSPTPSLSLTRHPPRWAGVEPARRRRRLRRSLTAALLVAPGRDEADAHGLGGALVDRRGAAHRTQNVSFSPAEVVDRFCSGECNTVATAVSTDCDADVAGEAPFKAAAELYLGYCSGCLGHVIKVNTTCGLGGGDDDDDDPTTGDLSRVCSGECNAVLKGLSVDCVGNTDLVAAKTTADDLLAYCSGTGCLYHSLSAAAACGNKMEATSAADQDRFCRGGCNAAITAASAGCDAAVASEAEHKAGADSYLDYCRNPNRPAVVLTLTASGVPSDYEDTTALASSIAALAGVDVSFVTITVAAGSVVITARITAPAGKTPAAIESAMTSALGTASAATAALGITVNAAPVVLVAEDTPTPTPTPPSPPPSPPPPLPPPPSPKVFREGGIPPAYPSQSSGSGRGAQPGLLAPFVLGLAGVLALAR